MARLDDRALGHQRGIAKKLANIGYSDRDLLVYNRLGPKARAVIYNAPRKVALREVLQAFHQQRKIPDPIWVGDEYYPQPLPSVYGTAEGDEEFALWLVRNVSPRKIPKVEVERAIAAYPARRVDLEPTRKVAPARERGRDLDL